MTYRNPVHRVTRRQAIGLGAGAALLAACSTDRAAAPLPATTRPRPISPTPTPGQTSQAPTGPATEVVRGNGNRPEIALTFHGAGDLDIARRVLAVLDTAGAKVTVLAVGSWVASTPDGVRMFHDAGHEIGNHTYSHGDLAAMAEEPTLVEIERCRDALVAAVGTAGKYFRQSDAQHPTPRELVAAGQAGYRTALSYDIDSLDWRNPGPTVIRHAIAAATAGSVVSMHLGHPGTLLALPDILRDLAGRGLTPVTASELLR